MSEQSQTQQQEPEKPAQSYLSRVRLKGYKSIIDTEVTFKPGLNIIIGANGSGKTNFVEFLKALLSGEFDKLFEKCSAIINTNINNKKIEYNFERKPRKLKNLDKLILINKEELYIDGKFQTFSEDFPIEFHSDWSNFLYPSYVTYNVPKEFQNIGNFIKLQYDITYHSDGIFFLNKLSDFSLTQGLARLSDSIFLENIQDYIFIKNLPFPQKLDLIPLYFKDNLKKFSPVKNIRLADAFLIDNQQERWTVDYIRFEFFVNDQWLTWNQLSDGTKRMFYIITEVTFANNVVLLEEPELGIHPDQLRKLLSFLREQAETKQIIITTHSPQVLNALKSDELDRIIIARYEKEAGTKLYHLTEAEMEHARSYMHDEGLFLSDYWVYSGFEKEEEAV
jgi:predicted ATP-dependent endonuclease of OLD family